MTYDVETTVQQSINSKIHNLCDITEKYFLVSFNRALTDGHFDMFRSDKKTLFTYII